MQTDNLLFYGDNLDVLRRHIKDETVDLIYLDPPFNSNANYNVLFKEKDGASSVSQIQAFGDTWHWDQAAASAYQEIVEAGGKVSEALQAFRMLVNQSDMLAYITMMTPRLIELHRVLKSTGSLYLHCDTTASHYLKIVLDAIFGAQFFRNEIVWKRTTAHNDPSKWGRVHDVILYYKKSDTVTWNNVYLPYEEEYIERFHHLDPDGRKWADDNLTAKGLSGGGYTYEYKGYTSLWRVPLDTMKRLDAEGKLYYTKTGGIRVKRYLDEMPGLIIQDVITDIFPINSQAGERLGYPTQKPLALLERIIQASSNSGDIVLDPFCGCGTAIAAAQKLDRRWIGIDITHLAINLIKHRLWDSFEGKAKYKTIGEPTSLPDAEDLAKNDPYQFQWWALGLVGARPAEGKKGADAGIDGKLFFHDDAGGETKQVVFSVKAGGVQVSYIRDLCHVVEREKAAIGVMICLEEPTKPMRSEAAGDGFYKSPWGSHPKIQILTITELLGGKKVDMPPLHEVNVTFKQAPKVKVKKGHQPGLLDEIKE
jgi:DNA modification methylase